MRTQISDVFEKMGSKLYGNTAVEFKRVFPSEEARTPQQNAEAYHAKYEMKKINAVKRKISKYL